MFNPGPGTYESTSQLNPKGFSMGIRTGCQVLKNNSQSLGPGTYDLPPTFKRAKVRCVFSKGKRFVQRIKTTNVGPGSYDLPHTRSTIAFSMRPKTGLNLGKNTNPGPGTYFPKLDIVSHKQAMTVFGKEKRGKENPRIFRMRKLGPGSYNPIVKKEGPYYSFGKDKKFLDRKIKPFGPGPGQYDIKSFLENYPAYATWNVK